MVFGSFLPKRPRKVREECARALADALNSLDYDRVANLVTEDVVVFNPRRGTVQGRENYVEDDRSFRKAMGAPQILIEDLIHHDDEILVRGTLKSDNPDVGGPSLWRLQFDGPLINRIEVTRADKPSS